jgi:hypothetical protein
MRRFHPLMLVLAGLVSLAAVPSSFAEVATVSIDWSQLQTQIVSISGLPAPSLTFSGQSTHLTDSASSAGDGSESQDHVVPNWTDTRNQHAHTTNADGTASANGSLISASASATAPPSTFCCDSNSNASVDRFGSFALSGPGSLIFSVPYTVSGSGTAGDFFNSSSASLNGSISFFSNEGGSSQGNKSVGFNSFSGVPFGQSGTLVFGIVADAAGTGSVDFQLSAFSQVFSGFIPEPSVYFQLAAGLGAIIVIGRRRIALAAKAI